MPAHVNLCLVGLFAPFFVTSHWEDVASNQQELTPHEAV
jgi:hypothetical protein